METLPRIEAHWSRFENGVFGYKQGDIYQAYSTEKIGKPFTHDGKQYITKGMLYAPAGVENRSWCYELLPFDETKPKPAKVQYSHEGEVVSWRGKKYRLGPKVEFVASNRTVEEWQEYFRNSYEHGGMFTSGKTYHQVLEDDRERMVDGERFNPTSNVALAISAELERPDYDKHEPQLTPEAQAELQQAMLFALE